MSSINKAIKKKIKKNNKQILNKAKAVANKAALVARGTKATGKGDYGIKDYLTKKDASGRTRANRWMTNLGEAIGSATGVPGLSPILGKAGGWLSRVFGFGDYEVQNNSLMSNWGENAVMGSNSGAPPSFGTIKRGSDIVFSHREFVADVTSSTSFSSTTYPINPGNPVLFPWMSQVASLYEEYEFLGLIFEFRTTCGTSNTAATPGMGVVVMATDYDCYDNNYTNKRAMEAAEFSSSGVPYQTFMHPIECDRKRNVLGTLYTVPGITKSSQALGDQRMSVMGNFNIATVGNPSGGVTIGELWVTYHVRLSRPILESATTTASVFSQHAWGQIPNSTGVPAIQGTLTPLGNPFGLTPVGAGPTAVMQFDNISNGLVGTYKFDITCTQGTNFGAWTTPAFDQPINLINCNILVAYMSPAHTTSTFSQTINPVSVGILSPYNQGVTSIIMNILGVNASFQLPILNSTVNAVGFDIIITPFNELLNRTESDKPEDKLEQLQKRVTEMECALKSSSKNEETIEKDEVVEIVRVVKKTDK